LRPLVDLVSSVFKSYPTMFANPLVSGLYLLVLSLVAVQYSRVQSMEERIYGKARNRALNHTFAAIGLGLLGGLFASTLLVFIGVSVRDSGISYLLPVALFLFLVSPRFLCYSYAGGLVSLSYLIFHWPEVNVPAIMALVACLHASEALLIRLSGHTCATPLYLPDKRENVVGGFALQRFWPIPLMVLFLVKVPDISQLEGVIHLPDWWPLLRAPEIPGSGTPVFAMMPVVAALGYADLALTKTPFEKSRSTAKNLLLFSIILLGFSIAASRWPSFAWVAALFSPLGHEVVIKMGMKEELSGRPRYVSTEGGILVLDVLPFSPADNAGVRREDVIWSVDGLRVRTREELDAAIRDVPEVMLTLGEVPKVSSSKRESAQEPSPREVLVRRKEGEPLGIIPAPEMGDRPMARPYSEGILVRALKNMADRLAGRPPREF